VRDQLRVITETPSPSPSKVLIGWMTRTSSHRRDHPRGDTHIYPPDQALPSPVAVNEAPTIEVRNESSPAAFPRLDGDIAHLVLPTYNVFVDVLGPQPGGTHWSEWRPR
jgi:hypothetical protein